MRFKERMVTTKRGISRCCCPRLLVQFCAISLACLLYAATAAGFAAEATRGPCPQPLRVAAVQIRASSDIKVACLTNLALCCQKEQKFGEALTWCEKALRYGLLLQTATCPTACMSRHVTHMMSWHACHPT